MSKLLPFPFLIVLISFLSVAWAGEQVKTVDFLPRYGLKVNAAGPLLVKTDVQRNRIILVNTNTSSISLIDGSSYAVTNIPVKNRVPQYLKTEAVTIDEQHGNIYVIGNKSLHIAFPEKRTAATVDTGEQYEMVAVNEKTGDAFLVGRASKSLLKVSAGSLEIRRIPWVEQTEPMVNLNQTPPPPIRKVVCDTALQQVIAIDGYTSTLYIFSATSGRLLKKRTLAVRGGIRWHMAGYNAQTHHLYTVIETRKRNVQEAVKIDVLHGKDVIAQLPGLTEGVGINYHPRRDEVYIPYDNHPSVHVVDFKKNGQVSEIKIPTYGNDASAIDEKHHRLYVSSWGYGDIEVIDLDKRIFSKRIGGVGIIPHMFNMTYNPANGKLFIPLGASAVNGSFGAALTVLDPESEKTRKIYTGWAPVAMVEMPDKDGFLVFNSEDQAAEVTADGNVTFHTLPCLYINNALRTPSGTIYASYGPHQSYWPVVYIWGAKNGILNINTGANGDTLHFYDRRIPRMAQQMVLDHDGALYALQNPWGREKQFLALLPDEVRSPNLDQMRMELEDTVERETTQRILRYDPGTHWVYIVRVGEKDTEPGILQVFDPAAQKLILTYPTGLTPTDLVFDDTFIYISNFDADSLTRVNKADFSVKKIKTHPKPVKLALLHQTLYCLLHNGNALLRVTEAGETRTFPLPYPGKPDKIFSTGEQLVLTTHTADALRILLFDPAAGSFRLVHQAAYPYGETTLDTDNSAFYLRGQFADGIFELNRIKQDKKGRLWISDYLSGKLFIISPNLP